MVAAGLARSTLDEEFATHRAALRFHCYQMLGSLADAEDIVQDTYGRAIDAAARFEGRSQIKTWLFRIATFACIDELRRRKRRKLLSSRRPNGREDETPDDLDPDRWVEPFPDALLPDRRYADIEAVTLAFVAALQHLSPRQRAILILRDTLDWSAEQVGKLLEMTTGAVHAALLRARDAMKRKGAAARDRSPEDLATARAFAVAFERRDVAALAAMLQRDVELHMPPYELWFVGADRYLDYVPRHVWAGREIAVTMTRANGRLAIAMTDRGSPFAVVVLDRIRRKRVAVMHAFVMPHVVPFFIPNRQDRPHRRQRRREQR